MQSRLTGSNVDLGFTTHPVPAGTHTCFLYRDEAEQKRIIIQYIAAGLRNGEKVVYLSDVLTKEEILERLRMEGTDLSGYNLEQGLLVNTTKSVYYPRGYFSPEEMTEQWRWLYEEAREEGHQMLRVTGETSWILTGLPGAERFVEYEIMLNEFLRQYPITVICQFNTSLFKGAMLADLINAHPFIIVNGQFIHNPFYYTLMHKASGTGSPVMLTTPPKVNLPDEAALLLTAAVIVATLPTLRRKIEFSERLLATILRNQCFYFCLEGYQSQSTKLACRGCKTRDGGNDYYRCSFRNNPKFVCYEIRTTDFFFGYLLLSRSADEELQIMRPSLVNFLNLLALSIENDRQKENLQTLNMNLQQEIILRKQVEDLLRKNEEQTARIMEGTDEGLWERDLITGSIRYDKNWQKVLGYEPGEKSFTYHWLATNIHPEDRPYLEKAFTDYIEGRAQYYESEYRIRTKSGEWKWVWTRGINLYYGKDNKPVKLGGTNRDITVYRETKEALRISNEQLAAAQKRAELLKIQKLESLGIMAGGIAHDFNNLLAAILSHVQLVGLKLKKGLDGCKDLQMVEKITLEAAKLTKQLLTFAKGGLPVKHATNLSALLKETAKYTLCGKPVKCNYELPSDLWMVDIDSGQIGQVIQNLVLNADQAMPQGGVITICATNEKVFPDNDMHLQAGNYVKVMIKDEGVGIPEKDLTRIFDPYFTTKTTGNGLGLASSYYTMKNHGGFIGVRSKPGNGSVFYLYLPVSQQQHIPRPKKNPPLTNGKGRILIMDDEPLIRKALQEFLESSGYGVAVVRDGDEAVKLFEQTKNSSAPFDLVIMDLTIPGGMGGKEAVQHILALDPNAKVIVFSGYSDDPVLADYRKYGFCDMITKPFRFEDISVKIDSAIHPNA